MNLSFEAIAKAIRCPAGNVEANWPMILEDMNALQMGSQNCQIAALATIAVETAHTFLPIHEYGAKDYFIKHYDNRKDLGNTHPGDGYTFAGRGYIQITGELNYAHYGRLLGIDLVANPDAALDPLCAAVILAAYFHERKVGEAADAGRWMRVRELVNGGTNGLQDFMRCVNALDAELAK